MEGGLGLPGRPGGGCGVSRLPSYRALRRLGGERQHAEPLVLRSRRRPGPSRSRRRALSVLFQAETEVSDLELAAAREARTAQEALAAEGERPRPIPPPAIRDPLPLCVYTTVALLAWIFS